MCSGAVNSSPKRRIYSNAGNLALLRMIEVESGTVLDVGCGAGDNARLIRKMYPYLGVIGVTHSAEEAAVTGDVMESCWVADIEHEIPSGRGWGEKFDVLLFSHVLEHLRDPAEVVARLVPLLRPGGQVLIAVPNILSWRMRLRFLTGDFEYESAGVLDDTHLRFFTFFTARKYLLARTPSLTVLREEAEGSVPLWWLRRKLLPSRLTAKIDQWGCRHWPNLFGGQVLISARKS